VPARTAGDARTIFTRVMRSTAAAGRYLLRHRVDENRAVKTLTGVRSGGAEVLMTSADGLGA